MRLLTLTLVYHEKCKGTFYMLMAIITQIRQDD